MDYPDHALHAYLRGLERRAKANRRGLGIAYSRRETAKILSREFQVDLDARRLSNWLTDEPRSRQAPTVANEPKLWALVRLWSRWAGEQPSRRHLNELLESAQPVRHAVRAPSPPVPSPLLPLLVEQMERGEAWPYVVHSGTGARRPLSAVHVQQQLEASHPAGEPVAEAKRGHIEDILEDPAGCHLLLESGPGSGKSTLLARLAGNLSAGLLNATLKRNASVPVWATAEQLTSGPGGVDRALSRLVFAGTEHHERRFVDATKRLLPDGYSWLLLVDGFDEIPMEARNRLAHHLTTIAGSEAGRAGHIKIIASCRPLHPVERNRFVESGFLVFTMAPFDRSQLETFAERWFGTHDRGRRQAHEFLQQVDAAELRDLVAVPLLAAVAAAVFEAWPEQRLPNNQYALFDQYRTYLTSAKATQRDHLFRQMRAHAGMAPWALEAVRFLEENLDGVLRHIATQAVRHLSVPAGHSDESDQRAPFDLLTVALEWLRPKVGPRAQTGIPGWGESVAALLTSSGLLAAAEGSIRFLHASFAEFLAAEARAMDLPDRFDGSSEQWQTFAFEAARFTGRKGRDHRTALVHYAHRRPLAADALLTWLLEGSAGHQHAAGVLMAEGCPYAPAQLRTFLSLLPSLPAASRRVAGRMSDPLARAYLAEQVPVAQVLTHTEEVAPCPVADEPLDIREQSVVRDLLSTLGCTQQPKPGDDTDLFCSLVCNLELESVVDRMTLIDTLHAMAPEWADHATQHMFEIMNSPAAGPAKRIHAAESLLDFDGEYLSQVAEVLLELSADTTNTFDDRYAAVAALSELGAPYRDQARERMHAMAGEPTARAYQRHELLAHVQLLTGGDSAPVLRRHGS
ncbi:NACHT domain-containing protein [Streptomyces sp. NPDC049627]|uniref:NACHT domain-containing protein n=1 Tax=Streptomyces sp. NPDC049627 TaxID=3365595 RepID=UPI0037B6460C